MASLLGFRAPQVQALVGELRSCKSLGGAKKKILKQYDQNKQTKSRKGSFWKLKCHSCVYISTTSYTILCLGCVVFSIDSEIFTHQVIYLYVACCVWTCVHVCIHMYQ